MAKGKYRNKNQDVENLEVSTDTAEETAIVSDASTSQDEVARQTATEPAMTKRAKRRAKEAALLESQKAAEQGKKDTSKRTVTAEQYKAMRAKKTGPKRKQPANQRKGIEERKTAGTRFLAWIRGIKAELKAVTWPPFKSTPKVTGVWANIGTVVLVVLFFMIVVTAFDFGLTAILRELVGIGNK